MGLRTNVTMTSEDINRDDDVANKSGEIKTAPRGFCFLCKTKSVDKIKIKTKSELHYKQHLNNIHKKRGNGNWCSVTVI